MNKKLAKDISQPFMIIGLVVMIILSVIIMWRYLYVGIGAVVVSLLIYLFHLRYTQNYARRCIDKYEKQVLKEREDYMDAFTYGSPLRLCVVNISGDVIWSSPGFDELFAEKEALRSKLTKNLLTVFYEDPEAEEEVQVGDEWFMVTASEVSARIKERRMLFFNDITLKKEIEQRFGDTRACAAYINVDNYDEMLEASPIEEQSSIAAQVDKTIHNWAISMDAVLQRARSDRYLMVFEHKYLAPLKEKRFPILNAMHDIETKADFPASLSIGICSGMDTLAELQDGAQAALELALGRGGDQAVVRGADGEAEYFGGALPTVEKRNKGKSRVMAHMLAQLIEDSENVMIVGHARPDMDSFGAALGVYGLASNIGKPVSIVLENPGEGIELIYQAAKEQDSFNFVDRLQALELLKPETLLVVVDHHRAELSEYPPLITAAKHIAVIDHHRRSSNAIENAELSYMEVYASSASELVTELLQYSGSGGVISRFTADALLAGITLDTKNFTVNSGVRTFEAASWLRRSGADIAHVKSYFKVSLDFYQKKARIISSAEILPGGIAVAYTKAEDPSMQVLVAQVADELLDMKGVGAAIVAGRGPSATMVSARSEGSVNVQTLMEKLGGGGHQTVAAAQVPEGPEEAIAKVVQIIREGKQ